MRKIKLNLSQYDDAETAGLADAIVESMTGNANFPTPDPTLATLTGDAEAIRQKQAQIADIKAGLTIAQDELVALTGTAKTDIRMMADHVQDKSDGNPDKIHSAGFEVVGDPAPRGPVGQVQNLRVQVSGLEGELLSRWKKVPGAASYVVDLGSGPEGPWTQLSIITRSSFKFSGLTPGTKYWVRVRAVGTKGYGLWSDPACRMAA